jgi:hypothetical protein
LARSQDESAKLLQGAIPDLTLKQALLWSQESNSMIAGHATILSAYDAPGASSIAGYLHVQTSYACKLARVQRGREEKECIWNSTRFGLKETDLHFLNRTELQSKENLTLSLGLQTVLQLALRNDIPMSSI